MLASIEGHDLAEVASLLRLPVGTVKSRLFSRVNAEEQVQWIARAADRGRDRVDPSPEFVARVRARAAMENTPSRWRMSPFLLTGATLATMAMAVWVVVVRVDRAPSQTMPVAHLDVPAPTPEHAGDATASTQMQTVRPRRQLHAQVIARRTNSEVCVNFDRCGGTGTDRRR